MIHHLKIQTHLDFFSPSKNVSEHFFTFTLSPLQFSSQLPLQIFLALLHLRVILDSSLPISNNVISVFLPDIFYICVLIYSQCYHCISGPDYLTLRQSLFASILHTTAIEKPSSNYSHLLYNLLIKSYWCLPSSSKLLF